MIGELNAYSEINMQPNRKKCAIFPFEKLKKVIENIKPKSVKRAYKKEFLLPQQILSPKTAHYKESEYIKKEKAAGRISAEVIIPYPPGIPLLIEGELITKEHIKQIEKDKIKVIKGENP